jgi:hypothetical protein
LPCKNIIRASKEEQPLNRASAFIAVALDGKNTPAVSEERKE